MPARAARLLWLLLVATFAMPPAAAAASLARQGDASYASTNVAMDAASPARQRDVSNTSGDAPAPVLVFAAASLQPAFADLRSLPGMGMDDAVVSHAATSQLARQIVHGAPANVFVSADRDWMDHLQDAGLIAAGSRVDLLGNALVLIAHRDDAAAHAWRDVRQAIDSLGRNDRIAMAEPAAVPAGRYARAALLQLRLWPRVEGRLVRTGDVRAALAFVIRGEARLGIVYASDLAGQDAVQRIAGFAAHTHPAIVYPAAVIADHDSPAARAFLRRLQSPAAREVFARHGFTVPGGADDR